MFADPTGRWPAGHRSAVIISFDVDGDYGESDHHGADDWYWRSQASYDLETGIWRLLRILDDFDVQATFCWVGRAAEDRPDAVLVVRDSGHEIASHGWDHRAYMDLAEDEQRDDLMRTIALLERITGQRPAGHKSPYWRFTERTVLLLQTLGFQWNMDHATRDLPWLMQPVADLDPIIQLAPSRLWDDYSYFVDPIVPPGHAFEMWRDDIDVLRSEGGLMCLTGHPWIIGRPGPSRALTLFLDYVVGLGDVWIARADQVARWWRDSQGGSPAN